MDTNGNGEEEDLVVQGLKTRINLRRQQLAEFDALREALRRDERALALLTGETALPGGARNKGKKATEPRPAGAVSRISDERMDLMKQLILQYAAEHEEFRQVDFRSSGLAGTNMNSSLSSTLFERLRQDNVLRIARVDGNSKYYRLTREALNELE